MSEAFSISFYTLIKLCYPKASSDQASSDSGSRWSHPEVTNPSIAHSSQLQVLIFYRCSIVLQAPEFLKWNIRVCVCVCVCVFNCVQLFATTRTVAHQAPLSTGFSRQEYWSGLPFPSPRNLPDPGIKPKSPALEADALTSEPPGKPT